MISGQLQQIQFVSEKVSTCCCIWPLIEKPMSPHHALSKTNKLAVKLAKAIGWTILTVPMRWFCFGSLIRVVSVSVLSLPYACADYNKFGLGS